MFMNVKFMISAHGVVYKYMNVCLCCQAHWDINNLLFSSFLFFVYLEVLLFISHLIEKRPQFSKPNSDSGPKMYAVHELKMKYKTLGDRGFTHLPPQAL